MIKNLLPHVYGPLDYLVKSLVGIAFILTLPYWVFVYPILHYHFSVSTLYAREVERAYLHGYEDGHSYREINAEDDIYKCNIPNESKKFWIANLCSFVIIVIAILYFILR